MRVTQAVLVSAVALAGCDRAKDKTSQSNPESAQQAAQEGEERGEPGPETSLGVAAEPDGPVAPAAKAGPPRKASGHPVLAAVFDGEVWVFIDTNGSQAIEGSWPLVRRFSSGLAAVNVGGQRSPLGNGVLGGHYEYIDPSGRVVVPGPFENPGLFWNDRLVTAVPGGGAAAFDKGGKEVAAQFEVLAGFYGGLSYARKQDKSGFLDGDGEWAFELPADTKAGAFHDGYVSFTPDGENWGFLDTTGAVTVEPSFELAGQYWNGLAVVKRDGKYGFVDTEGTVQGSLEWDDALPCHEKRCPVQRDGVWGYLDEQGAVAIEPQFEDIRDFHSGKAAVLRDAKVGYIGLDGSVVIEPKWSAAYDFHFGRAAFSDGKKVGFLDETGAVAIEPQYVRAERFVDVMASNESSRSE